MSNYNEILNDKFPGVTQDHLDERANFNLADHLASLRNVSVPTVVSGPPVKTWSCGCQGGEPEGGTLADLPRLCPTHEVE